MDIKCSECHKELTDTGKCVGCSLFLKFVHVILLRNMIRLVHSWKQMLLVPLIKWNMILLIQMRKPNHRTRILCQKQLAIRRNC